eukprot:5929958-Ditylum_brightwellii.AAC.1
MWNLIICETTTQPNTPHKTIMLLRQSKITKKRSESIGNTLSDSSLRRFPTRDTETPLGFFHRDLVKNPGVTSAQDGRGRGRERTLQTTQVDIVTVYSS